MRLGSKKGTAMVEAAVVLPMVILITVALIHVLINLYVEATAQAATHIEERNEAAISVSAGALENMDKLAPEDVYGKAAWGRRLDSGEYPPYDEPTFIRLVDGIHEILE